MKIKQPSGGKKILSALAEIVEAFETGDSRKLTVRHVHFSKPVSFNARQVKQLRAKLGLSQGTLGQLVGVSRKLVEHWESGIRKPSTMACRLLETIREHPEFFLGTLKSSAA